MTITVEPQKVNVDGREFFAEFGKITDTMLGREDHGIFTFILYMDFNGSAQGAGTYGLNDPTQFGNAVQKTLDFFGTWEAIKGSRAYALREERYGLIRGLMDINHNRVLLFGDWKIVGQN